MVLKGKIKIRTLSDSRSTSSNSSLSSSSASSSLSIEEATEEVANQMNLSNEERNHIRKDLYKCNIKTIGNLKSAIETKKLRNIIGRSIAAAFEAYINSYSGNDHKNNQTNKKNMIYANEGIIDFAELADKEEAFNIRNPSNFRNEALYVHRVAPIPNSTRGKIVCTWAMDVDPERCLVKELLERISSYTNLDISRLKLIFSGCELKHSCSLSDYDIMGGSTLYLYSIKPNREKRLDVNICSVTDYNDCCCCCSSCCCSSCHSSCDLMSAPSISSCSCMGTRTVCCCNPQICVPSSLPSLQPLERDRRNRRREGGKLKLECICKSYKCGRYTHCNCKGKGIYLPCSNNSSCSSTSEY